MDAVAIGPARVRSIVEPSRMFISRPMRLVGHIVVAAIWVSATSCAVGQATFLMQNIGKGLDEPVYDWTGAELVGVNWRAELYGGVTEDSLSPVVGYNTRVRELAPFVLPGYFVARAYVCVPEVPELGLAWLQVKVWNIQLGATYEEVVAQGVGGYGQSSLFYARGGSPSTLVPPSPLQGLTSFSVLEPIPEPTTWVMLLVGGGIFWLGSRRSNHPAPGKAGGAAPLPVKHHRPGPPDPGR